MGQSHRKWGGVPPEFDMFFLKSSFSYNWGFSAYKGNLSELLKRTVTKEAEL